MQRLTQDFTNDNAAYFREERAWRMSKRMGRVSWERVFGLALEEKRHQNVQKNVGLEATKSERQRFVEIDTGTINGGRG